MSSYVHLCLFICFSSFFIEVFSECPQPLVMPLVDSLPDDRFFTSIGSVGDHPPSGAKLSSEDAWCSVEITDANISPYIQVNFTSTVEISSIAVGGHTRLLVFSEYIGTYNVKYRPPGQEEQFIIGSNQSPQNFAREGNVDLQTEILDTPIITDILQIRVVAGSWFSSINRVCIKFEAYGCIATVATVSSALTSPSPVVSSSPIMVSSNSFIISSPTPHMASSLMTTLPNISSQMAIHNTTIKGQTVVTTTTTTLSSSLLPGSSISAGSIKNITTTTTTNVFSFITTVPSNISPQTADNVIVIASSSAGFVVVVIVVLLFVVVCAVLVVQFRRSRRKVDYHHSVDNDMYGYSMEEELSVCSPEQKTDGVQQLGRIPDNRIGNIYDSADNLMEEYIEKKEEMLNNGSAGVHNEPMYEAMDGGGSHQEKYDYVQRSNIVTQPVTEVPIIPPQSSLTNNSRPDNANNTAVDVNNIRLSLNPVYSDTRKDPTTNGSPDPPPYSSLASNSQESTDSKPLLVTKEDMVDNPLYGEGSSSQDPLVDESNDDMVNNPLYDTDGKDSSTL